MGVWMTRAVEASEQLIALMYGNEDIVNHAGGCSAEMLASAESALGIVFPPSYRRLVKEFGTWEFGGEEYLGVYQTSGRGEELLGSVAETRFGRKYGLPLDLLVVMSDGMGGLIVLDQSRPDQDGEYPVLVWNPGSVDRQGMERLGDDFGSYALGQVHQALRRKREAR